MQHLRSILKLSGSLLLLHQISAELTMELITIFWEPRIALKRQRRRLDTSYSQLSKNPLMVKNSIRFHQPQKLIKLKLSPSPQLLSKFTSLKRTSFLPCNHLRLGQNLDQSNTNPTELKANKPKILVLRAQSPSNLLSRSALTSLTEPLWLMARPSECLTQSLASIATRCGSTDI